MKLKYVWTTLLLAYASAIPTPGRGANLDEADDIIARIDSRMSTLDSLIFRAPLPRPTANALEGRLDVAADSAYSDAVDAVANAHISEIKAQTGLQLTGQTYFRADGALGLDDEDESVSRYTGKIQAEARWYFLQSGLLKRHGRIEEQRLKADIDRLTHERGRFEPGIYARRERLRIDSDSILASVMLHRVDNLVLLEEAYLSLLQNENISGDNLLRILDDRAEAERRLATISTQPVHATSLGAVMASTVEIDTAAVVAALSTTDIDLRLLDLKSDLLDRQAGNTTWWSDVRLAPFVRYSHYFRHAMPSSSNIDVGLSFTIPVNAEASRKRSAIRAQKRLIDCERDGLTTRAADRVRYIAMEAERLNRSIAGEWQRAASLRAYLKVRRNAYENRAGEFNRLLALMEYNSYLRCLENIIEMQYRRDSLLADLQALVPAVSVLEFCSFTPLTLLSIQQ